jgi:hypothetical protein
VPDWVYVIECDSSIQSLGYLAWAACGKDPGFSPAAILEHARRSGRYSVEEVAELSFSSDPPDAAELSRRWHTILQMSEALIAALPPEEAGRCVLTSWGALFRGGIGELEAALERRAIRFHEGSIRGALPQVLGNRA